MYPLKRIALPLFAIILATLACGTLTFYLGATPVFIQAAP